MDDDDGLTPLLKKLLDRMAECMNEQLLCGRSGGKYGRASTEISSGPGYSDPAGAIFFRTDEPVCEASLVIRPAADSFKDFRNNKITAEKVGWIVENRYGTQLFWAKNFEEFLSKLADGNPIARSNFELLLTISN